MKNNNLISIIIVNRNGKLWLQKCISSILDQSYTNFEIIFVDNASTDDSIEYLKSTFQDKRIKITQNNQNLGFAGGNNIGFESSKGEYILLINNDTIVEKDLLSKLINEFQDIKNCGVLQPKLISMKDKDILDSCGSFWTDLGFLYHFGNGKNILEKKYNKRFPIFSCKGACMLIKSDLIEQIGLFDNDFWCYYEETDFCNRVWLVGYECRYSPNASIYHAGGGSSIKFANDYIHFQNFKNKLSSIIKNFELINLLKIIPIYIIENIIISFFRLLLGKLYHFFAIYKAFFWNLYNIKKTLQKRKIIQALRKKSDFDILQITKKNPHLSYYYYLFIGGIEKYKDIEFNNILSNDILKPKFKKDTENFFDKYYNNKSNQNYFNNSFLDNFLIKNYYLNISNFLLEGIFKNKNVTENTKILDIGCGGGEYLIFLYNNIKKGNYFGVDISEEGINKALKNIKKHKFNNFSDPFLYDYEYCVDFNKFNFQQTNGIDLPYENNYFDIVYFIMILHHTYDYEKIIKETFRVLKQDGIMLIIDLKGHNKLENFFIKFVIKIMPKFIIKKLFKGDLILDNFEIPLRSDINFNKTKKILLNLKGIIISYSNHYLILSYFFYILKLFYYNFFMKILKPFLILIIYIERIFEKILKNKCQCFTFIIKKG